MVHPTPRFIEPRNENAIRAIRQIPGVLRVEPTRAVAAKLAGIGGCDAYPWVAIDAGAATLAFALSLPLLAALPYLGLRGHRG